MGDLLWKNLTSYVGCLLEMLKVFYWIFIEEKLSYALVKIFCVLDYEKLDYDSNPGVKLIVSVKRITYAIPKLYLN